MIYSIPVWVRFMARIPETEPISISLTVKNGKALGLRSVSVSSARTALESGPITQRAVYWEVTSEILIPPPPPPLNACNWRRSQAWQRLKVNQQSKSIKKKLKFKHNINNLRLLNDGSDHHVMIFWETSQWTVAFVSTFFVVHSSMDLKWVVIVVMKYYLKMLKSLTINLQWHQQGRRHHWSKRIEGNPILQDHQKCKTRSDPIS